MRIFLTGFMGSGKTYVGNRLAQLLDYPFIDLDVRIEEQTQKSIRQIFADEGEQAFRQMESEMLQTLSKHESIVIATGGGTPCHHNNMEWMNQHGLSIFLDVAVPILVDRLRNEREHRPLIKDVAASDLAEFISQKRTSRLACYQSAMVVYQQNDPEEEVWQHLFTHLPSLHGH